MAQTLTSKLKLAKHDTGDLNWGTDANANMDALDAHVQQAVLRPPRTLSATLGSGAVGTNLLGNTTYFYKVTAINAVGETTEGQIPAVVEAQVTQPATPLPVILQWETVSGATGYKIYKATALGQEQFLAQITGQATSTYTDTGNTATTSATVPASNTARTSVSQIVAGSNITVNPPDGTGAVTVNATVPTPPAASDTIQGDTKLSVAPAIAGSPIAVGINDPSVTNARTPTGTAGSDLSGTYPNPTVAKVNGVSVPAAPSAGQVLTATGPTAAAWQAASGGGYATVVVAAPSGVAATDTTNIQNAINTVGAAGGGTVVLRDGTYQISSQLTLKSNVTILGQGKGVGFNTGFSGTNQSATGSGTTLLCTAALGSTPLVFVNNLIVNVNNITFKDLTIHFGFPTRPAFTGQDFVLQGSNTTFINVAMIGNAGNGNPTVDITPNNINDFGKNKFIGCDFYHSGNNCSIPFNLDGEIVDCYFEGTVGNFTTCLARLIGGSVTGCYFATNQNYLSGTLYLVPGAGSGTVCITASGNYFKQISGTNTHAIFVDNIGAGSCSVFGNNATSTSCGDIRVAVSTSPRTVAGNAGFSAYTGGTQSGNDGQSPINSGSAAGGDLAGTYPNPTVAKVNSISVPASPSAGQVLTATGPTAAAWQTPAAGGGGYATVVAAAPTGVAVTDTAAIQAAVNALPAAGGTVILREGNYALNASITLPSGKPIELAGQGEATLLTATANISVFTFSGGLSTTGCAFRDFRFDAGANASAFLFDIGFAANQVMADFEFSGIHCLNANRFINALPQATGSVIRRWKITRNHIEECGYLCFINDNGVGSIDDVSIEGNQFRRLTYNSPNVIVVDGTDISIKGNTIFDQGPSSASTDVIAWNRPISKAVIANNVINGGARGIGNFLATPSTGRALTDSAIVGNVINAASFSFYLPDSANANVLIAGNRCVTPINLLGGTGFTIVGNIGTVNDTSGGINTIINTTSLGGDLGGTYPNPTVAKVNGIVVPAAPAAGQVLTATGPTAAAWQAPAGGGNWKLVANLTNTVFGQTFTPDFTGLSLAAHRSYMLLFELSLSSGGVGPNWVALRLNGGAPTTLQQYMLTDQQGATQDNEGATNAMAKIFKIYPVAGSVLEVSGCIIITGQVNAGFPHAVGWYTVTNQSAIEQMHRGNVGLRMNLGSGVDLTSLGLFSNIDLNFLVAGSDRMSLYQAQ